MQFWIITPAKNLKYINKKKEKVLSPKTGPVCYPNESCASCCREAVKLIPAVNCTHLGADFVETCGDGCGRGITSEHVALQHPRVFVSRHVGKVPET